MTYLLRLSACLFFLLSFNAFAVDTDGDGIDDENDNCPLIANLECSWVNGQYTCIMPDTDSDGIGDACETFDVELNTFQNGQVADANKVNENFNNLKLAFEELKETIDNQKCYLYEGLLINNECISPEIDLEDSELPNNFQNLVVASFNTAEFVFRSSNYIRIEMSTYFSDSSENVTCNLLNPLNAVVASVNVSGVHENSNPRAYNILIEQRGIYQFSCSGNVQQVGEWFHPDIKFSKDLVAEETYD